MSPSRLILALPPLSLLGAGCANPADSGDSASFPGARPPDHAGVTRDDRADDPRHATSGGDADGDGSLAGTDCDDTDATAYPGAPEADDLVDDDCDGWVDEDFVTAGDIVFTEINRQSRFGGAAIVNDGSWVEVRNTSARTVDLAGWVLARGATTGNQVTLDPATAPVLASGDYAVLCDSNTYVGSAGAAWPLSCDYVWGDATQPSTYVGTYHDNTFALRRDSDAVALYVGGSRTSGTEIDRVAWSYDATDGYWPRVASHSMSLDPAYQYAEDNDDRDVWCSTTETSAGVVTYETEWRWYDTSGTSRDEYGTPGADNYDCPVDPDLDGDGHTGATDCDDHDPAVHPAAGETCDGVDEDCDGVVDDGAPGSTDWYADADADGYGDVSDTISACAAPDGYVADATDCDDTDPDDHPGALELCDGEDDDCDDEIDVGALGGTNVFFADVDGDGHGDAGTTTTSCLAPTGHVETDGDCDDGDASAYPGATEADDLADDDCDGWVDEDFVAEGDVVISEIHRQARFGGAVIVNDGSWVEVYNASARTVDLASWVIARGVTTGNSVTLDPDEAPVLAPGEYAVFCDSDLYTGSSAAWALACDYVWGDPTQPASYVGTWHDNTFWLRRDSDAFALYVGGDRTTGTRVDRVRWSYDATNGYWPRDARFSTSLDPAHLDATDNDTPESWCSTSSSATGSTSNDASWQWYDVAGSVYDEHGTPGAPNYDCIDDEDGDGYTDVTDCDDADATVYPGAGETCDGVDEDCDGAVDEDAGTAWYADADADGFGDPAAAELACAAASGWVADATDCDDTDAAIHPGATEVCDDHVDEDCDPDPTPCAWSGSDTVKADYDFRAYGTAANHAVGHSTADNGDFDGDGYDDVVVGQAYHDTSPATDNGRALLWYGPVDTSDALATADLAIEGSTTVNSDQFGWASRFAGDLDGDGDDELLVAAWKAGSDDRGRAYLFAGGTSPTSVGDAFASFAGGAGAYTGTSLDGADVDGDGLSDVMVGAYARSSAAGAVAVWLAADVGGGAEDLSSDATLLVTGGAAGDNLGYAAALASDLDGDGLADLVAGAPATASTVTPGAAYVFYSLPSWTGTVASADADAVLAGSTNGDRFGLAVAGLGDTDGDGRGDFVVTADKEDSAGTDAGAAYVFVTAPSGATPATAAASTLRGEASSDYFGRSAAGLGDIDGDGLADLALGATGYDANGWSLSGGLYVFYGPLPTGTAGAASAYDARFTGANTADAVGYGVSGGGDVNADGFADFMASAPSWDGFGLLNSGGSWLYYGRGE